MFYVNTVKEHLNDSDQQNILTTQNKVDDSCPKFPWISKITARNLKITGETVLNLYLGKINFSRMFTVMVQSMVLRVGRMSCFLVLLFYGIYFLCFPCVKVFIFLIKLSLKSY